MTLVPESAKQAPATNPTYPEPTTAIFTAPVVATVRVEVNLTRRALGAYSSVLRANGITLLGWFAIAFELIQDLACSFGADPEPFGKLVDECVFRLTHVVV